MSIRTQMINFPSGTSHRDAYLAEPEGDGLFPGVVVIHEVFGLNENIKAIADRFAHEGYTALAVDLFSGRNPAICMIRFMYGIYFNSLNHRAIHDLKAALTFLAAQPQVDAGRTGAIGFCMGGSFAIAWACTDHRLNVIAPFYASNPRPLDAVARICPVAGSYPSKDFTAAAGRKLASALDGYHIPHDIKIYPDTKHSFFNDLRPASYNPEAANDAWQRVLAFFGQHISGASGK